MSHHLPVFFKLNVTYILDPLKEAFKKTPLDWNSPLKDNSIQLYNRDLIGQDYTSIENINSDLTSVSSAICNAASNLNTLKCPRKQFKKVNDRALADLSV